MNPAGETRCLGPIPIGPTLSHQELRYREILLDSGLLYQQLPTESCATNAPHHNCHAVSVPKQLQLKTSIGNSRNTSSICNSHNIGEPVYKLRWVPLLFPKQEPLVPTHLKEKLQHDRPFSHFQWFGRNSALSRLVVASPAVRTLKNTLYSLLSSRA